MFEYVKPSQMFSCNIKRLSERNGFRTSIDKLPVLNTEPNHLGGGI